MASASAAITSSEIEIDHFPSSLKRWTIYILLLYYYAPDDMNYPQMSTSQYYIIYIIFTRLLVGGHDDTCQSCNTFPFSIYIYNTSACIIYVIVHCSIPLYNYVICVYTCLHTRVYPLVRVNSSNVYTAQTIEHYYNCIDMYTIC